MYCSIQDLLLDQAFPLLETFKVDIYSDFSEKFSRLLGSCMEKKHFPLLNRFFVSYERGEKPSVGELFQSVVNNCPCVDIGFSKLRDLDVPDIINGHFGSHLKALRLANGDLNEDCLAVLLDNFHCLELVELPHRITPWEGTKLEIALLGNTGLVNLKCSLNSNYFLKVFQRHPNLAHLQLDTLDIEESVLSKTSQDAFFPDGFNKYMRIVIGNSSNLNSIRNLSPVSIFREKQCLVLEHELESLLAATVHVLQMLGNDNMMFEPNLFHYIYPYIYFSAAETRDFFRNELFRS